jgi:hypothetical protein
MSDLEPTRMPDGEIRMMAQQPQAPTIGRIVLFSPSKQPSDAHRVNGSEEFVAIIGQVFADPGNPRPYCNLLVMPPFAAPYWEGSVQEVDPDADAETTAQQRTWRWPPRA